MGKAHAFAHIAETSKDEIEGDRFSDPLKAEPGNDPGMWPAPHALCYATLSGKAHFSYA